VWVDTASPQSHNPAYVRETRRTGTDLLTTSTLEDSNAYQRPIVALLNSALCTYTKSKMIEHGGTISGDVYVPLLRRMDGTVTVGFFDPIASFCIPIEGSSAAFFFSERRVPRFPATDGSY
jgi:hypothetical protein